MYRLKKYQLFLLSFIILSLFGTASCAKKGKVKPGTTAGIEGPSALEEEELGELEAKGPGGLEEAEGAVMPAEGLGDVYFDYDKAIIGSEHRATLEKNAQWLKANAQTKILIEGHCDERGTIEYNLALGDRRANAARDYLISLGIDPSRIATISYGEEKPFDPGHNEEVWSQNRRAHFVLTNK
ncbi:MAG: peptidoglycan-associated lipoprotein [Nitrospinae bacterium RIFCSPLOWO2_12_FULL_45_22]|nr:MAG: peptidoglycan-associated lipoprotein [Nitrospinae bacterium RIFCSPLOWO2_12_FULL_45_22]